MRGARRRRLTIDPLVGRQPAMAGPPVVPPPIASDDRPRARIATGQIGHDPPPAKSLMWSSLPLINDRRRRTHRQPRPRYTGQPGTETKPAPVA